MLTVLTSRFKDVPALVSTEMSARFDACLAAASTVLMKIESAVDKPSMEDDFWYDPADWRAQYRPYCVKDGILQIPVKGVLLHDFPYAFSDWATGYPYIWRAFQRGMDDSQVKGIALVVDSPGGEVAGNFDLVDKMFARREEKEIRAYAAESMYSAAYSIGSVATKIIVSRTGGVGSIGVVTGHVDMSGAMEQRGFKLTFIHFGKHKVDGNPYEPLPKAVQARIQKRIDELGEVFVSTVARNRGMDEQVIRDTEALTYTATEAVANGLADEVGSLDDSLVAFATDLETEEEDETMAVITQADVDAARAAGVTEGKASAAADIAAATASAAAATAAGAKAERERINGIIASDAAKTKPTAALAAALDSDMTVEQASKFLAKLPEEKIVAAVVDPKGGKSDFAALMDKTDQPNVGADKSLEQAETVPIHERALAARFGKPKAKVAA